MKARVLWMCPRGDTELHGMRESAPPKESAKQWGDLYASYDFSEISPFVEEIEAGADLFRQSGSDCSIKFSPDIS